MFGKESAMKTGLRRSVLLFVAFLLLSGCDGMPLPEGYQAYAYGTPWPTPLATPTGVSSEADTVTICMGNEPVDLFLYNEPSYQKLAVLAAIYDGPIDRVNYQYQPVLLEKIPSLADGDAVIEPVSVSEGRMVLDAGGQMAPLLPGLVVRPAGCRAETCAVTFEGGAIEMDQMRVTFRLKPGILWSDGVPLTAWDSVFSYRVATSEVTTYGLGGLVSLSARTSIYTADYTALDDLTVVWTGLPGFLDPTYQANFFIPLPQHTLARYSVEELLVSEEANRAPLGWGPYMLTGWEAGVQMVLERNPYYFRAAEGLPLISRLVYRFVGQDYEANLAALQSGACDILLADALPAAPTSQMLALNEAGQARLVTVPGLDGAVWEHLTFAVAPPADEGRLPIFSDRRVRQAAAFCLDRQALADAIYSGYAPILDTYLPLGHPLLMGAEVSVYPFDPVAGTALLEEVGWRDEDGDGVREAHGVAGIADGTPLRFSLVTTEAAFRAALGDQIREALGDCGMDVAVIQQPGREIFAQDPQAALTGRHFDLAEYSSPGRWLPPCEIGLSTSIPSETNYWNGSNLSGYSNPEYDAVCQAALLSLPGTPEYADSHREALRIFSADLPVLPLFVHFSFIMTRPDVGGLTISYTQGSELTGIELLNLVP
jgi:peptide/nickel transport system substrate-binding protein